MKIGIASDHRGYKLKTRIIDYLKNNDYEVIDYGTNSEESVDYPLFAFELGKAIQTSKIDTGIALCGTGIGISIAMNKVKGVICAKVSNKKEAELAKVHNHANSIAFSGEVSFYKAKQIIKAYLNTKESKLEKHQRRVKEITDYESKHN